MQNIVSLVPKPALGSEPDQSLIDWFEMGLEKAKSGELQAIAGACQFTDGAAYHIMGNAGTFELMGALQMAAYTIAGIDVGHDD